MNNENREPKKIIFLSTGGGTGKTTIISNLGYLYATGFARKVGLVDLNFTRPDLAHHLGVSDRKMGVNKDRVFPVKVLPNLFVISNEFLLSDRESPIVLRNYMHKLISEQFFNQVDWKDYDILFIDTPSALGNEILDGLNIMKYVDGVIITTRATDISLISARRILNFISQYNLPLIGIIANMGTFECDNKEEDLFRREKFNEFIEERQLKVITRIPFDRDILKSTDNGVSFVQQSSNEQDIAIFKGIIRSIEEHFNNGK